MNLDRIGGFTLSPLGHREQFSAEYLAFSKWYTPERFRHIWRKARFHYWDRGYQSPVREFIWDVGVSHRTVSRWLRGAFPSRMALIRLQTLLQTMWGEDWMQQIDEEINEERDT